MKDIRLVHIVTHPITACNLMRGQLQYMRLKGFEVILISAPGEELNIIQGREGVTTMAIPMAREIDVFRDFTTLIRLYRTISKLKPSIVNAGTPKAGFLGMLAAWMARVPVRIYILRGLRLETKIGFMRVLLTVLEQITSACAHRIICVSRSLRHKFIELHLAAESKTIVVGNGSSNGIDLDRFLRAAGADEKQDFRGQLGVPADAMLIGFIGRLTQDKGISDLLDAFQILIRTFSNLYLLLVGDFEMGDPVSTESILILNDHPHIIRRPFLRDPVPFYSVLDVLAFPSHREGFPNAPLEAAAMGIPTVGFQATGVIDAVEDGVTGRLVPVGNARAFAEAISAYLRDDQMRLQHGSAARQRVMHKFKQKEIWEALYEQYMNLLYTHKVIHSNKAEKIPATGS